MRDGDTIVALSSGAPPSGVAIIRLSGPAAGDILRALAGGLPEPRKAVLRMIRLGHEPVDTGLVVFFPSPHSFTGEDCAELQVHGSPAVVRALLRGLAARSDVRLAEAGEFTRRAFENGKLDLTEVEGLGDLLRAETENQRVQALGRMIGGLSERVDHWRSSLLHLRAEIEARLDFSDEGDVSAALPEDWFAALGDLRESISAAVETVDGGRIVREGFRVALAGPPNAGKSSLLNALAKSDLAIVSEEAGTTRDVREVPVDLVGQLVIFVDMAGLRETESAAEAEGVRRARTEIKQADLVLWLVAPDAEGEDALPEAAANVWRIGTKADLGKPPLQVKLSVSARTGRGLDALIAAIAEAAGIGSGDAAGGLLVSRERDRAALAQALTELDGIEALSTRPELAAEALRRASDALARLVGALDAESVLDRLFLSFCIGK